MSNAYDNDPYAPVTDPAKTPGISLFGYMRVISALTGLGLILIGAMSAVWSFNSIKAIIETPDTMNAYLDAWYTPEVEDEPEKMAETTAPELDPPKDAVPVETTAKAPAEEGNADAAEAAVSTPPAEPVAERAVQRLPQRSPVTNAYDAPLEALASSIRQGGLARLIGALILLALVSLLVRIPFGLIKAGTELVRVMTAEKSNKDGTYAK
ncbi:MAG TPA: hypothetical protein PLJ47_03870 [Candidatus Hydrogenedentes bacterium]|nr:hypothetical protein [Candidatus Hydrogenedentota bacterium]